MVNDQALQMHEELVDCSLIDVLPIDKTVRSFNKEFAHTLAISLKEEGLYNPIVVRPNPAQAGRYILVQGRHRLYAWFRILKENMIRATVLPTMDEPAAAMAAAAENIWRWECKKAQHIKALKIWHDHFVAKQQLAAEAKSSGVAEPANEFSATLANNSSSTSEAEPAAADSQGHEQLRTDSGHNSPVEPKRKRGRPRKDDSDRTFAGHVATATGQSTTVVRDELRLARLFSSDELDMFTAQGTTEQQMEAIAGIKDQKIRGELIALIGAGMELSDAWLQIFKTPMVLVGGSGGTKDEKSAKAVAKAESVPELSDEEWLSTYCSEKMAVLGHPEKFKSDAILYRHTTEVRAKFRSRIKTHLQATSKAGTTGYLWSMINRLVSISAPKDWFNCPECGGSGAINGTDVECPKCRKAGYLIRTERYE